MKRLSVLICVMCLALVGYACIAAPAKHHVAVDTLQFSSAPALLNRHYCAACCFADAMQVMSAHRTGVDPGPLSPQYLMTYAGPRYLDYSSSFVHGFGAFVGADMAGSVGTCKASMCPPLTWNLSAAMNSDAAGYCCQQAFLTLHDVPDYPSAVAYLGEHPGSVVVLTTGSLRAWAIIGVDSNGLGIWLDHWDRTGPPNVLHKSEQDGIATWNSMVNGQYYTPDNYIVLMNPR